MGHLTTSTLYPPEETSNYNAPTNYLYFDKYLIVDKNYLRLHIDTKASGTISTLNDKYWCNEYDNSNYYAKTMYFYNKGVPIFGVYFSPSGTSTSSHNFLNIYIDPTIFNFTSVLPKLSLDSPSSEITSIKFNTGFLTRGAINTSNQTFTWNQTTSMGQPTGYRYYTTAIQSGSCEAYYSKNSTPGIYITLGKVQEQIYYHMTDSNSNVVFKFEGYPTSGSLSGAHIWFNTKFFDFSDVFPKFY